MDEDGVYIEIKHYIIWLAYYYDILGSILSCNNYMNGQSSIPRVSNLTNVCYCRLSNKVVFHDLTICFFCCIVYI